MLKDLYQGEKGSVTLLFLVILLALTFFGALVMDIGLYYFTRARLSRAADAAVLAGVQQLPGDAYGARVLALDYVELNGFPREAAQVSITEANKRIEVQIEQEVPFSLGQIFGVGSKVAQARAAAVVGSVKSITGAVPFGVEQHNFEYGKQYILKQGAGQAGSYKGNFGALALGGKGAANYLANLINGFPGEIEIGDVIETEPGNMSGPTTQGVSYRINQDPQATWENHSKDSPRIIKVPVVQYIDKQGRSTVKVVGFAAFFLEGVGGSGHNNYVVGRFLKMMVSNNDGSIDESGGAGTDFGVYSYKLVI
ncbi:MAG: Tad domain-containing protein [Firmicutes bacterium]|nr:Tad domain-containing protein [Bacillota bacterium]